MKLRLVDNIHDTLREVETGKFEDVEVLVDGRWLELDVEDGDLRVRCNQDGLLPDRTVSNEVVITSVPHNWRSILKNAKGKE